MRPEAAAPSESPPVVQTAWWARPHVVVSVIIVHGVYVSIVRPNAAAWWNTLEVQSAPSSAMPIAMSNAATPANFRPRRSVAVSGSRR